MEETDEQLVEDLIEAAKELGKFHGQWGKNTYSPALESGVLQAKSGVLRRMKQEAEIVPGLTGEPLTTTPQPPNDPESDDSPRLFRITQNPFEGDDGPG